MEYKTGAIRSDKVPHFRDLPLSLLTRGAEAYTEGWEKYEKGKFANPLEKNWRKGDREFAADALDHLLGHVFYLVENLRRRSMGLPFDNSEDHLGHAVANLGMISEFEEGGLYDTPPVYVFDEEDATTSWAAAPPWDEQKQEEFPFIIEGEEPKSVLQEAVTKIKTYLGV